MEPKTYRRIEDYDQEFLLKAYDTLSSDGFRKYIAPLIWSRVAELEERIINEDKMDEQNRCARNELIKIANLSAHVKQVLGEGQ